MLIQKNVKLAKYTTFHIGGRADFFAEINNVEELKEAVNFAKQKKLKIWVLGGGSNTLISDKGFPGLVLRMNIKGVRMTGNNVWASSQARFGIMLLLGPFLKA